MTIAIAALAAAAAMATAAVVTMRPAVQHAAREPTATVLQVVHRAGHNRLVVRKGSQGPTTLVLHPDQSILTQDGRQLSAEAVLAGDRLRLLANGALQDSSQRTANIHGVVLFGPDPGTSVLALSLPGSGSVLVDAGPQTAFHDPSGRVSSLAELAQADMVQVNGVLDTATGEMTETDSVTRLGP